MSSFLLLAGWQIAAWQVVERGDNWLVEKRQVDHLDEVRVSTTSRASPERLFETAWNIREQARYAPNLKLVRVIDEQPDKLVVYEQVEVPFIVDRDYVVEITRYRDAGAGLYQIFVKSTTGGPPPAADHVRMTRISSTWTFEPSDKGGTVVTLSSYGDPSGNVPPWLVRLASTRGPSDFVRAVVKRAESK